MNCSLGAALTVMLASVGAADVGVVLRDSPRDGVADEVLVADACLTLDAQEETRYCEEFELPPRPVGGFVAADFYWLPSFAPDAGVQFELSVYAGDGVVTLEDFSRPAVFTQVYVDNRLDYFNSVEALHIVDVLIDAGATHLGVRVRPLTAEAWPCTRTAGAGLRISASCPVCAPDWDGSGGVDGDDIGGFLSDWYRGRVCTDLDGSGGIDVYDFVEFLDCWLRCSC